METARAESRETAPEKAVTRWLVLQSEYDGEENGGLFSAATMFSSMKAAIDFVQHVLRDEWTVEVDADTDHPRNLADCRGMAFPKGSSIKSSDAYYSEDGMEAWAAGGRGRYAIKVVPYRGEGIRAW